MTEFLNAGNTDELSGGGRKVIEINDHEVLLLKDGGNYHAVSNICTCITAVVGHPQPVDSSDPHTHGGRLARLEEADVRDGGIECPEHHSRYDLRTGKPLSGAAEIPLDTYEVRVSDKQLEVAEMADAERHFYNDDGESARP
ncbi:MAG: Rieske 2Fe-2S domain-containing protein [Xanthomonadales bacterium]|nr:Rieske 2Fe-2S domain-containing protein [Xanthomonadales bacterium]